ncbi:hypothetical protein IEN85_18740 [Pelagicoccus sp. NFK12]|uniref:Uncharacterized protein n=1 Tax=Pelagicoccus enzymogenes TaxID=2773457 RepID=A0A927IIR9_9BACT|nr:hypothetical protein [Pelagicoccus enzymogenes]MBD5781546.1 hypothetical protein [Pelagicoccus enzymogenes]
MKKAYDISKYFGTLFITTYGILVAFNVISGMLGFRFLPTTGIPMLLPIIGVALFITPTIHRLYVDEIKWDAKDSHQSYFDKGSPNTTTDPLKEETK